MYKAFKFRIYPNNEQKVLINKTFGSIRFIYNYYLSKNKSNGYMNPYSNIKDYVDNTKKDYPFLTEVDSLVIRKSIFSLDDNLKKYYNNHFGYPKFKSKYSRNSYTTSAIYREYKDKAYCNIELDLLNRRIKLM